MAAKRKTLWQILAAQLLLVAVPLYGLAPELSTLASTRGDWEPKTRLRVSSSALENQPQAIQRLHPEIASGDSFHAEAIGTIRALTDEQGNVTDRYTLEAFGTLLDHQGQDPNAYLFAGEPLDPNSGFYYNRARWLEPNAGRFASMDPLELDASYLHRYLYASQNPVGHVDPTGLFEGFAGVLVSATIAGIVNGIVAGAISYAFNRNFEQAMLDAAEGFFWGFALGVIGGVISKAAAASRVLTTAEKARTGQAAVAKLVAGEGETLVHENLWYYVGRGAKVVKGEVDILTREALHEVKNYVWKSYDDYLISKVKQRFARQVANRRLFLQEAAGLPGMPTSNRIVFWLSRGAPREVVAFLEGLGVEVRIFIP